jgi:hypothetical protein
MNPHEETALQLALTESSVPHGATPPTETNNANNVNANTNVNGNVGSDADTALLPLAMPPSPTLLSHAHNALVHHHGVIYANVAGRLAMLSEAGHNGPGAANNSNANVANNNNANANDLHAAAMAAASVHSYFQHEADAAALAAGIGAHHFDDMDASDKPTPASTIPNNTNNGAVASGKSRKRKAGANVSIDLQTKIRLIELAEEFQYDPKHHGAHANGANANGSRGKLEGRDAMSGMRLAAQFGLNKSTVSRILKRKDEFKKAYYKDNISGCSKHINKKSKFEKLNRLVENWFDVTREKKVAVSDTLIRDVGKRFAEELGIEDFRGSNGWVRSLRNRKEQQARNMSLEALERERVKKDAEAMERVRAVFPAGIKDMAGFFKDLTIFLEKDGGGLGGGGANELNASANYMALDGGEDALADGDREAEEFLKKKMIESLRSWSQELMELDLSKMKSRLKSRPGLLQQQQAQLQSQQHAQPSQLQQQQQQQLQLQPTQQQQQHQTAVI